MATVATPPPVRHGRCNLVLTVNGTAYKLRRVRGRGPHARSWSLTKDDGTCYFVTREHSSISCTCPDHQHRSAACKHQRALVACGLLSGRKGVARV